MFLVALTLFATRRAPLVPLLLLVVAGWFVMVTHAALYGPVGFGLLTIAAIWIRFRGRTGYGRWE
jgi:hypothetical protein